LGSKESGCYVGGDINGGGIVLRLYSRHCTVILQRRAFLIDQCVSLFLFAVLQPYNFRLLQHYFITEVEDDYLLVSVSRHPATEQSDCSTDSGPPGYPHSRLSPAIPCGKKQPVSVANSTQPLFWSIGVRD
jgi:hypothetical protein